MPFLLLWKQVPETLVIQQQLPRINQPLVLWTRALGVDATQVGLEVADAPAAVSAQLQVAVALVGALHQQRDGLGLRLGLHGGGAVGSAALPDAR